MTSSKKRAKNYLLSDLDTSDLSRSAAASFCASPDVIIISDSDLSSEEDDPAFYIKMNRILDKKDQPVRRAPVPRIESSLSSSDDDDDHQRLPDGASGSLFSSSDDSVEEDEPATPSQSDSSSSDFEIPKSAIRRRNIIASDSEPSDFSDTSLELQTPLRDDLFGNIKTHFETQPVTTTDHMPPIVREQDSFDGLSDLRNELDTIASELQDSIDEQQNDEARKILSESRVREDAKPIDDFDIDDDSNDDDFVDKIVLKSSPHCPSLGELNKKTNNPKDNAVVIDLSSDLDETQLPVHKTTTSKKGMDKENLAPVRKKWHSHEDDDDYFLSSLDSDFPRQRHPDAEKFVKRFKQTKADLPAKLLEIFNRRIFSDKISADMRIDWNARLLKTAGRTYSKRCPGEKIGRLAKVELSTKVCDSAERVRDTFVHELCHVAVWIVNGLEKEGHGKIWKAWAQKVSSVFPKIPLVMRCHTYKINAKFTYKCTKCAQCINRHSKSLDVGKRLCGRCHGTFELFVNTAKGMVVTPSRPVTGFAKFVQDNYSTTKAEHGKGHKDIMKLLTEKFKEAKF